MRDDQAELIWTLHPRTPGPDGRPVCATCRDDEPWPCPTLLVLRSPPDFNRELIERDGGLNPS